MAQSQLTTNAAKGWAPDLVAVPMSEAVPEILLRHITTVAGKIEGDEPSLRVPFVHDDSAEIVAEGAPIDLAQPILSETVVRTNKIAQIMRISRELYAQSSAASLLSGSVSRAIVAKANHLLIQGDVDAGVVGLIDAADIQTTDPVADGLDALIDLIASIESEGGVASHLVVAPSTWASLRKLKSGTGSNASLIGAGTEDAERRLLSLPVMTSAAVPPGSGLVVDKASIVSAAGDVLVAVSEDVFFQSDSVGLRATLRVGTVPARGTRLGKFSIAE